MMARSDALKAAPTMLTMTTETRSRGNNVLPRRVMSRPGSSGIATPGPVTITDLATMVRAIMDPATMEPHLRGLRKAVAEIMDMAARVVPTGRLVLLLRGSSLLRRLHRVHKRAMATARTRRTLHLVRAWAPPESCRV